uniref:Uncharacterized protein n=1 Tax=Pithovirus LCPAC101 TaxID=2506586 RepID=A0A481Z3V4_9VIRU|nr:MAG: hypothetical protein LCPAC101_03460 [Pithovirus LCPAC101]
MSKHVYVIHAGEYWNYKVYGIYSTLKMARIGIPLALSIYYDVGHAFGALAIVKHRMDKVEFIYGNDNTIEIWIEGIDTPIKNIGIDDTDKITAEINRIKNI